MNIGIVLICVFLGGLFVMGLINLIRRKQPQQQQQHQSIVTESDLSIKTIYYPAKIAPDEEGVYVVRFKDLSEVAYGVTFDKAFKNAIGLLIDYFEELESRNEKIPVPSEFEGDFMVPYRTTENISVTISRSEKLLWAVLAIQIMGLILKLVF